MINGQAATQQPVGLREVQLVAVFVVDGRGEVHLLLAVFEQVGRPQLAARRVDGRAIRIIVDNGPDTPLLHAPVAGVADVEQQMIPLIIRLEAPEQQQVGMLHQGIARGPRRRNLIRSNPLVINTNTKVFLQATAVADFKYLLARSRLNKPEKRVW